MLSYFNFKDVQGFTLLTWEEVVSCHASQYITAGLLQDLLLIEPHTSLVSSLKAEGSVLMTCDGCSAHSIYFVMFCCSSCFNDGQLQPSYCSDEKKKKKKSIFQLGDVIFEHLNYSNMDNIDKKS